MLREILEFICESKYVSSDICSGVYNTRYVTAK